MEHRPLILPFFSEIFDGKATVWYSRHKCEIWKFCVKRFRNYDGFLKFGKWSNCPFCSQFLGLQPNYVAIVPDTKFRMFIFIRSRNMKGSRSLENRSRNHGAAHFQHNCQGEVSTSHNPPEIQFRCSQILTPPGSAWHYFIFLFLSLHGEICANCKLIGRQNVSSQGSSDGHRSSPEHRPYILIVLAFWLS